MTKLSQMEDAFYIENRMSSWDSGKATCRILLCRHLKAVICVLLFSFFLVS